MHSDHLLEKEASFASEYTYKGTSHFSNLYKMPYDSSKTTFSPEGHLLQVQYAHRAVQNGSLIVALRSTQGIVVACEQKLTARLQQRLARIQEVYADVRCVFSGLGADARILLQQARLAAASYQLRLQKNPNAADVARDLSKICQEYTQKGGRRPFGVCCVVFDKQQIYTVDPSGVCAEWEGIAVGGQAQKVQSMLEERWKKDMNRGDLEGLAREAVGVVCESDEIEVCVC